MALQSIKGGLWVPRPAWSATNATPAFVAVVLDASTDRVAGVFRAPKTGNIDQVAVRVGAITTSAGLDVRIETVNTANDDPTGTLWNSPTNTTSFNIAVPSASAINTGTLTAVAAVTRGNVFAVVVQPSATPISLEINTLAQGNTGGSGGTFPYGSNNTTGAYADSSNQPVIAVRYDDGEWVFLGGAGPVHAITASAFDDGTDTAATTGSRRGLYFQLPFPATLSGMWAKMSTTATSDCEIRLYDSGGSLLATFAVIDASQRSNVFNVTGTIYSFDSDYNLAANTNYRLVIAPTTTNNVTLYEFSVSAAAHMDAFEGGQNFHLTKFVSSAWSEVTTERPMMGLLLTALDDGVGGSGGGLKLAGGGGLAG